MTSLIVLPSIQSGIYRISSLSPELYLELQSDNSLRATKLNKSSDSQKWEISPDEDGTYEIKCVLGNRDLLCEMHPTHNNPLGHSGMMSKSLWTIDPRGVAFAIANARDNRVLDLVLDDRVGFSERDGVRGQRWILHLDDTLVLREKMAAIQPYSIPPQKLHPSLHQPQESCPVPNPLRIRKAPPTQGVVREGIYRIASSIRRSEGACFLELQEDNSIKVVALNETSKGQQWMFTHYQNSKYFIKSSLNSHALAIRPSVNDSNLRVPVGDDSFASAWTIEPRHDAYFIGVLDDIRVLDLTENNTVVFENLNGCTTQQWDLDPVRFQYQPTFKEGVKYLIRNRATGGLLWANECDIRIGRVDDDSCQEQKWILKNQEDGGTAIQSGGHWAALECHTSTTAHSYRFIPAEAGSGWYFICPDMLSDPPQVMEDNSKGFWDPIDFTDLNAKNERQMWELVPKTG